MPQPTKEEILAKYKDRISATDFQVLSQKELPKPVDLQKEKAFLEFWGRFKGWTIWAKKAIGGILLALILLHDGWETYRDFSPYAIKAYEQVQIYAGQLLQQDAASATDYIVFAPEQKAPAPNYPPSQDDFIFSGTAVYPVSGSWGII